MPSTLMQSRPLTVGAGLGTGDGETLGSGDGDDGPLGAGFGADVGRMATVASGLGPPCGAAADVLAEGRARGCVPGRLGMATGERLTAGAGGGAKPTEPCWCGAAVKYTAVEAAARTAEAVPQATE
jgi:hypothetical protein